MSLPSVDELFAGTSILIVEDDPVDARQLTRALASLGHDPDRVVVAETLTDALESARNDTPALVLADLTLPDSRDLDTVRSLVEHLPLTPIIVQTGREETQMPLDALEIGAQDYLVKGRIDCDTLGRSLRHALARQRLVVNLTTTERDLRKALDELDEFTAIFAHDLRGPVRSARLLGQVLLRTPADDRDLAATIGGRLEDALERVDRLILSMLDYESLRSPRYPEVAVPLLGVIDEALAGHEADLEEAGATVTVRCAADLSVRADPDLLARVLMNLVANAVKFRHPERPLAIGITATPQPADRVSIRVGDNGIGIAPDDRERVFHVLERLSARFDGLGFGLAVCRRIIEAHGGTIAIADVEGDGTAFDIDLAANGPLEEW